VDGGGGGTAAAAGKPTNRHCMKGHESSQLDHAAPTTTVPLYHQLTCCCKPQGPQPTNKSLMSRMSSGCQAHAMMMGVPRKVSSFSTSVPVLQLNKALTGKGSESYGPIF
jgi:hypothetical protein